MYIYNSYFVKEPNQEQRISYRSITETISHHSDWKLMSVINLSFHSFDLSHKNILHIHMTDSLSEKDSEKISSLSSVFSNDFLILFHIYDVSIIPNVEFTKNMIFCVNTNNKRLALKERGINNCFILVPGVFKPLLLTADGFDVDNKNETISIEYLSEKHVPSFISAIKKLNKSSIITNIKETYDLLLKENVPIQFKPVTRETLLAESSGFFVFDEKDVSAYLQPWIYNIPVYGVKPLFVIDDFERQGVVFSQIYESTLPVSEIQEITKDEVEKNKRVVAREYSLNAAFRVIQKMLMYGFTDKFQKNFEKLGGQI